MDTSKIIGELKFKAVRSSGAGGQNVNKVSSKVVLSFDVEASGSLSIEEKALVREKLSTRITADGILLLQSDEDRSQLRNKDIVTKRFVSMIGTALQVARPRKATKVPKSVIRKRLRDKKNLSERKQSRRKPDF